MNITKARELGREFVKGAWYVNSGGNGDIIKLRDTPEDFDVKLFDTQLHLYKVSSLVPWKPKHHELVYQTSSNKVIYYTGSTKGTVEPIEAIIILMKENRGAR